MIKYYHKRPNIMARKPKLYIDYTDKWSIS